MPAFVTREQMEAEVPGLYQLIAPQFRDRLPAGVEAVARNAEVIRNGFGFIQGYVDRLFARLKYREGEPWPLWKLAGACYLIESELGKDTLRQVGTQIYQTMPWPQDVANVVDAFRFMDAAYRASHGNAPSELVGGWPVESVSEKRVVVINSTPYPFWMEDGTVQGVLRAFPRQAPRAMLLDPESSKRGGGLLSRYEITFERP